MLQPILPSPPPPRLWWTRPASLEAPRPWASPGCPALRGLLAEQTWPLGASSPGAKRELLSRLGLQTAGPDPEVVAGMPPGARLPLGLPSGTVITLLPPAAPSPRPRGRKRPVRRARGASTSLLSPSRREAASHRSDFKEKKTYFMSNISR